MDTDPASLAGYFVGAFGTLIVLCLPLFFAIAAAKVATLKGYSGREAGAAGCLFGVFALLYYGCLPINPDRKP